MSRVRDIRSRNDAAEVTALKCRLEDVSAPLAISIEIVETICTLEWKSIDVSHPREAPTLL
jgi:hypothetical protein